MHSKQNILMIILKFSFSTIHSPPDNFYITEHTFNAGDSAQVCQSEGEEFSCPTAEASINLTCDRTRCPLQGPPMAPIMESQPLTGWTCFGFKKPPFKSGRLIFFEIFMLRAQGHSSHSKSLQHDQYNSKQISRCMQKQTTNKCNTQKKWQYIYNNFSANCSAHFTAK